jgi:hypothetical protein
MLVVIETVAVVVLAALLLFLLRRDRYRAAPLLPPEPVLEPALVEPDLVSDPAWTEPLAPPQAALATLEVAAPRPVEPPAAPEPERAPIPIVLVQPEPEPEQRVAPKPEPVAAHDPFASFWLAEDAPLPNGLTAGYLPPLNGMWQTPLGERL